MEESDADSDSSSVGWVDELTGGTSAGLGDSDQSDIEVSSVHSSEPSDFDEHASSSEDALSDAEWSDTIEEFSNKPFVQDVGPKVPLGLDAEPIEYFLQLFPEEMFILIRDETERYARQNGNSAFHTTVEEMKAYLGMLFLMGVIQLPHYRCYWNKRRELKQPAIADVMTRNRYETITRYFHLNDSMTNPPRTSLLHDKLHKVRPVLENAKKQFLRHYSPHQNLAVDEAMVKFEKRCNYLQYDSAKPSKWDIKAWALVDCETFYLLDFDVYFGKRTADADIRPQRTKIVTKLVEAFCMKHHHIYFSNFFTSVRLLELLQEKETYACGSVQKRARGLPAQMRTLKLKNTGDVKMWQKGCLTATAWCEKKRQINLLSTVNNKQKTCRHPSGRRGQPKPHHLKPAAIQDYINNFSGVDKSNQLRSHYGIAKKAKKWWKYLFWFVCDVSLVNAYILYSSAPGGPRRRPLSQLDFHLAVATALIAGYSSRKRKSQVEAPEAPPIKAPVLHEPTKITTARGVRVCILCSREGRFTSSGRKIKSSFECVRCGVALCKDKGCFGKFHGFCQ